jgi:hypothetical protein
MAPLSPLEQLGPIPHLAVLGVLDLQPRGEWNIGPIRGGLPFRHDALQLALAHDAVEVAASGLDVICEKYERRAPRDQPPKNLFPLDQGALSKVPAFKGEYVEYDERWITASKHQVVEPWPALAIEADDLTIEHCIGVEFAVDEKRKVREPDKRVRIPGDELRPLTAEGEQSPEAVVLQLEDPLWMIERLAASPERHGIVTLQP